jgi:hypothetical protein
MVLKIVHGWLFLSVRFEGVKEKAWTTYKKKRDRRAIKNHGALSKGD